MRTYVNSPCVCAPCIYLFYLKRIDTLSLMAFTLLMTPANPRPRAFVCEHRSQRGVYRATEVPRDHDTLRTIPMYGNMLQDHTSLAYFDALEEIADVREAEAKGEFMPDWVPFSESEVCQLCKADFSWASTSKSEVRRVSNIVQTFRHCNCFRVLLCGTASAACTHAHRSRLPT